MSYVPSPPKGTQANLPDLTEGVALNLKSVSKDGESEMVLDSIQMYPNISVQLMVDKTTNLVERDLNRGAMWSENEGISRQSS